MSYTKNTWTNGDTITAEKLNNMENGIANAGGTLIVGVTVTVEDFLETAIMDKTWQEIHDALAAGLRVITMQVIQEPDYSMVVQDAIYQAYFDNEYYVYVDRRGGGESEFYTDSPSGYPSYSEEPS